MSTAFFFLPDFVLPQVGLWYGREVALYLFAQEPVVADQVAVFCRYGCGVGGGGGRGQVHVRGGGWGARKGGGCGNSPPGCCVLQVWVSV